MPTGIHSFRTASLQAERKRQNIARSHHLPVLLSRCPFRHSVYYAECLVDKQSQHSFGCRTAVHLLCITIPSNLDTAQAPVRIDDQTTEHASRYTVFYTFSWIFYVTRRIRHAPPASPPGNVGRTSTSSYILLGMTWALFTII